MKKIKNKIIIYKGDNLFDQTMICPYIDIKYVKDKKILEAIKLDQELEKYEKENKK